MEKRTLTAFLLIIVFFAVWSQFAPQQDAQLVEREEVRREKEFKPSPEPSPYRREVSTQAPSVDTKQLREAQVGNYHLIYSLKGGYIDSVSFGEPGNLLPFRNIGFQPATRDTKYQAQIKRDRILFKKNQNQIKEFVFEENLITVKGAKDSSLLLFSFFLNSDVSHIDRRYFEVFYKKNGSLERKHPERISDQELFDVSFAGARSKYQAISLLKGNYDLNWKKNDKVTNLFLIDPPSSTVLFLGPQTTSNLKPYGLESIIYYGFWHFLAVGLIRILYFFYSFLHNWGLSVILLSFLAYAVLFPFTSKSSQAMKKMQEIQPLMQELKEKYKDKPQKMQKEVVALYKEHKVNPLGGCLPLIFQFPIIIAFYQVVFRFPELQGASFLWIQDLAMPDQLFSLPFTIPLLKVQYFNLLPILVMVLGIIQQQIIVTSSNPQQKKIGLFMGVFMGIIFYNFPSALVLYWFIQNVLTFIYQLRLKKARTA